MYGQLLTGLMTVIINGIVLDIRFAEMYKVYETECLVSKNLTETCRGLKTQGGFLLQIKIYQAPD